MADISGMLGTIDSALGAPEPWQSIGNAGGASGNAPAYPVSPGSDSAGAPAPLDTDIIVRTPARPRIVQGVAPAGDALAVASPSANAIYAGGQQQPSSQGAPQKSTADQVIDAINAAIDAPTQAATHQNASPQSAKPSIYQVAEQPGVGFNEVLADTAGAPVDLVQGAMNLGQKINRSLGLASLPEPQTPPVGGSQSIKSGLGLIGANPDEHPANSTPERIARGIGSGAASLLLPAGAIGAASETGAMAPQLSEALGEAFGAPATGGQAAGLSAMGASGGAAGNAASEAVPEPYKPYAEMAGNILGGGGAAALGKGIGFVGKGAGAVGDFLAPLTAGGRQKLADRRLAKGATSPTAALDTIENEPRELVPGSKPTTFQLTGDRGLGQMERQAAKKSPAPFLERAADQTAHRVEAIKGIAPNGDPAAVSATLRSHLAALDEMAATVEARIKADAVHAETSARENAAHSAATATETAAQKEARAREGAEGGAANARGTAAQQVARATQEAQRRAAALGGEGTPEAYGSALRARLQAAKDAAKANERKLWQAVDPDGRRTLDARPISWAGRTLVEEVSA